MDPRMLNDCIEQEQEGVLVQLDRLAEVAETAATAIRRKRETEFDALEAVYSECAQAMEAVAVYQFAKTLPERCAGA
jgi:hypothetical protein